MLFPWNLIHQVIYKLGTIGIVSWQWIIDYKMFSWVVTVANRFIYWHINSKQSFDLDCIFWSVKRRILSAVFTAVNVLFLFAYMCCFFPVLLFLSHSFASPKTQVTGFLLHHVYPHLISPRIFHFKSQNNSTTATRKIADWRAVWLMLTKVSPHTISN